MSVAAFKSGIIFGRRESARFLYSFRNFTQLFGSVEYFADCVKITYAHTHRTLIFGSEKPVYHRCAVEPAAAAYAVLLIKDIRNKCGIRVGDIKGNNAAFGFAF